MLQDCKNYMKSKMFVATKASALKGINANSCETFTFHNKTKKTPQHVINENRTIPEKKEKLKRNNVGDMKKLRYEIIKFGTSGFSGKQKEDANVALMVSLGAEPPKKKARNYKEILMEKKNEKSKTEDDKYKSSSFPPKKGMNTPSRKNRKKDLKGLLDVYGEVNKTKKIFKKEGKRMRVKK